MAYLRQIQQGNYIPYNQMLPSKKYLFLYPKGLGRPGFKVQLEPIINYLCRRGHECYAYFGEQRELQIESTSFTTIFSKKELNQLIKGVDYIYIRNVYDFVKISYLIFFVNKNNAKLIYNFRGFACYENYYGTKNPFKFFVLFIIEFVAYRFSNHVSTVSTAFKNELAKHYGNKKEISVIPCCVSNVFRKRQKEGRGMRFVYCGSMLPWQKFQETLVLFKKISESYRDATLVVFTKDQNKAKTEIEKLNVSRATVKYLEHPELLNEIRKYDFAFLLRDKVMLNKVASPVKFAEYIANGLVPIISSEVGDYSKLVKNEKIGIVVNERFDFDFELLKDYRNNPLVYEKLYLAAKKLTWEENLALFPH